MVITANIAGWGISRILIDLGSSDDIIFAGTFDQMKLNKSQLQHALGKVALPVSFGTTENARTEYITFDVVDLHYTYNAIFGRGFLNRFNTAAHMGYLCMKIAHGVITIHGSQKEARNIDRVIYMLYKNINSVDSTQEEAHQPQDMPKGKTDLADQEETECIPLEEAVLDRRVTIAATLSKDDELQLLSALQKNKDIFA
jgi:hypothetical protein